jgi:hypothetical protein
MKWYYAKDGQPAGPVEDEELERLTATGDVTDATLVWRSGLAEWKPYGEVRYPAAALPARLPEPDPADSEPEIPAPVISPIHAQEMRPPYAGFWIRFAAMLFDCLILLPVMTVVYLGFIVGFPDFLTRSTAGAHASALFELVVLAIAGAYQTWFVGRFAARPARWFAICA